MTNKDKQYYIYIRSINKDIPVSKEVYQSFYKETSVFRRRKQRSGECVCPSRMFLNCDTDCENCQYKTSGKDLSLNYIQYEDTEKEFVDSLVDDSWVIEDLIEDGIEMEKLFKRITEIMPEAIRIGELRLDGMSDKEIAEAIGIPRTTFLHRLKSLKKALEKENF